MKQEGYCRQRKKNSQRQRRDSSLDEAVVNSREAP